MAEHQCEVLLSGVPNEMVLIGGLIEQTRPDLSYLYLNDPSDALVHMELHRERVVGVVGSLARIGMFENAQYTLTPLLDTVLMNPQYQHSSIAIISAASCATMDVFRKRHARVDFCASLCRFDTFDLARWAANL